VESLETLRDVDVDVEACLEDDDLVDVEENEDESLSDSLSVSASRRTRYHERPGMNSYMPGMGDSQCSKRCWSWGRTLLGLEEHHSRGQATLRAQRKRLGVILCVVDVALLKGRIVPLKGGEAVFCWEAESRAKRG
jgi:hypothetical protein